MSARPPADRSRAEARLGSAGSVGPEPLVPRFFLLVVILGLTAFFAILLRPVEMGQSLVDREESSAEQQAGPSGAGAELYLASGCGECHTTSGADSALGPSLAGAGLRAESRIAAADYGGSATTGREYLVESILSHCADRLPGYDCPDVRDLGLRISLEDAEALADFLDRLPAEVAP